MQRRHFIRNASLVTGALALSSRNLFARRYFDDPYKTKALRNNVGIFTENGGTIAYLTDKKGIVVVDAQFPDSATHLITWLKGQTGAPFDTLINTHHHGDHTAGNISFKGIVQHVSAHENCKANMVRVAKEKNNEDKQLYPDITWADNWHYKIGHESIRTHYFGPAHTNGDAIIHFEHANIAHMGDLMFNRMYPYIDKTSGASISNWITVIDKTMQTFNGETVFVFGHAKDIDLCIGTKEDLKGMKNYLEQLLAFTDKQMKAGKTKEDILKTTAIPNVGLWKDEFGGTKNNLEAAYQELGGK
jgi:cyclase